MSGGREWTLAELRGERCKVQAGTGCWVPSDVGHSPRHELRIVHCKKNIKAQRLAWALLHGLDPLALPSTLEIRRACKTWRCINPEHCTARTLPDGANDPRLRTGLRALPARPGPSGAISKFALDQVWGEMLAKNRSCKR